jgi:ketosteroid isomerase-like protein
MLAAAAVAVSCGGPSGAVLSDAERATLTDSVTARSAEWRAAVQRADAAAILAFYHDGPETAVVNASDLLQKEATLGWLAASLPNAMMALRSQAITATDQRFAVLDRDAVVETAVGEWTGTDTTAATTSSHFAFTRVWVRRDGTWKIIHSHLANVPMNPARANQR